MGSPITYTAIGDSLTVGVGAFFRSGFVKRYTKLLESYIRRPVRAYTVAEPRITSAQLLQMIRQPQFASIIYQSDVITICIGGNDLLQANRRFKNTGNPHEFQFTLQTFAKNLNAILSEIHRIKRGKPCFIQLIGLYNGLPNVIYSDHWIREYNHILRSFEKENMAYVDTHVPFNHYGKKLYSLGIHPNGRGHQLIANQLFHSFKQFHSSY